MNIKAAINKSVFLTEDFPNFTKLKIHFKNSWYFKIYFYFRIEFDVRDTESNDDLFDLYYKNTDLKLLLDILATSSGIAHSLSLLTMLDANLRKMTLVRNVSIEYKYRQKQDCTDVVVTFEEASAIDIFRWISDRN